MSITAPPQGIVDGMEYLAPGLWRWFGGATAGAWPEARVRWLSSWWRSPDVNRRVGGHPHSQHLLGLAFDVNPDANANAFRRQGLVTVAEGDHLHVQVYPAGTVPPWVFERLLGRALRNEWSSA